MEVGKDTHVRVLTWNLFHGRSVPETRRSLLPEFAEALAGWPWDVALLQEVPPWWPPDLARATGAGWARNALTSRNGLLVVRRALASRRPDLLRSNGGGANAILVRRAAGTVQEHRRTTLRRWPERRVAHAVRLEGGAAAELTGGRPLWIVNLHASKAEPVERARQDGRRAVEWAYDLAGPGGRVILGGDLNDREPAHPGLRAVASRDVDHVLVPASIAVDGRARQLPRTRHVDGEPRRLSDHLPLTVALRPT